MYEKRYDFYQNFRIFFWKIFDFFVVEWIGVAPHFGASATLSNRWKWGTDLGFLVEVCPCLVCPCLSARGLSLFVARWVCECAGFVRCGVPRLEQASRKTWVWRTEPGRRAGKGDWVGDGSLGIFGKFYINRTYKSNGWNCTIWFNLEFLKKLFYCTVRENANAFAILESWNFLRCAIL